jgi:hypothetical protein
MTMKPVAQRNLFEPADPWYGWVEHLVNDHFYSPDQIRFGVDMLAVYRDPAQRIPLMLVQASDGSGPTPSAIAIARRDGFSFVAAGEPVEARVVKVGLYEGDVSMVVAVPTWMPRIPRRVLIPKSTVLLPFQAEEHLRSVLVNCHDAIYKILANDPAAAFDLLLLVMAAKVLDETGEGTTYRFGVVEGETDHKRAARLNALLVDAATWLDDNDASHASHAPVTSARLVSSLLTAFQDYSLSLTADSAGGTDVLGTAYEAIVGATFRGELGSYFTPRTIADFVARMLAVREGRVLDPACGSAGLLLGVRRMAGAHRSAVTLYGNDLNPRMVRAAKVNFLLYGLDPRNVFEGDGLQLDRIIKEVVGDDVSDGYWWNAVPDGPFDAVLANPPFAGHESDDGNLARIETAHRADGSRRSLNRTLPFVESIVAALRIDGVAGLVLPTSALNAEEESFVRFRRLLLEHVELLAIIGLPEKAFVHTDCGVHGALLFLKRVSKARPRYDVFVDWAQHLGYDRLGRYHRENDFPAILQRYWSGDWPEMNTFSIQTLLEQDRLDPAWLHVLRELPRADSAQGYVPLTDIIDVRDARFARRLIEDDAVYRYFEVADTDLQSGRIVRVQESAGFELRKKGRIKSQVQAGDVLLPNHRDSLIAKGAPTGRSAVLVEAEHDGVLTTDRFIVLAPKIDPVLLQVILNSAGTRRQIVAQCRGAASLDIRERTLTAVRVPISLLEGRNTQEIIDEANRLRDMALEIEVRQEKLRSKIDNAFGGETGNFRPVGSMVL